MLYREIGKNGDRVSILGYGCMRLPRKNGLIDEERAERQIISAIEQGVNYFDTAYLYPNNESTLGKILAKGYRDKVLIATKLPSLLIHSRKDMEKILETQLKRLQTNRIDYYLIHSIMSLEGWRRLKQLGVESFLKQAQQAGKIRRIGFSYHGDKEQFKNIVDDYPWDFCQIQYNYVDESYQAGKDGLIYAASKGLGVVIMEPLRGGALVGKMPPLIKNIWEQAEVKRTPADWALRWVWNHPEVSLLLSGMNEESHIEENIRVAESAKPQSLSDQELKIIAQAKTAFDGMMKVGCTGCGYCIPCPAGVNIPLCFAFYNNKYMFNDRIKKFEYLGLTIGIDGGSPSYASLCRNCGKCEKHCPQNLPAQKYLQEVAKDLQGFYFKPVAWLVRGFYKMRRFMKRTEKKQ